MFFWLLPPSLVLTDRPAGPAPLRQSRQGFFRGGGLLRQGSVVGGEHLDGNQDRGRRWYGREWIAYRPITPLACHNETKQVGDERVAGCGDTTHSTWTVPFDILLATYCLLRKKAHVGGRLGREGGWSCRGIFSMESGEGKGSTLIRRAVCTTARVCAVDLPFPRGHSKRPQGPGRYFEQHDPGNIPAIV